MKRLKILILSSSIPYPPDDGAKVILFNLIKRLFSFHDLTLLALMNSEKQKKYIPYISKYCSVKTVIHKRKNNNINRIKYMFSMLPYGINLHRNNIFRQKLNELLRKEHFDILHSHYIHITQHISEESSIPRIVYAADCDSHLYHTRMKKESVLPKKLYFWWQWYRYARYEREIYKLFNTAIVVSETDREALKKNIPDMPIVVAPNGVDTEYYKCSNSVS